MKPIFNVLLRFCVGEIFFIACLMSILEHRIGIGINFPKLCCLVAHRTEVWNQRPNSLELDYN
jgi:hypothetical protein